jgi:hypothetical protein
VTAINSICSKISAWGLKQFKKAEKSLIIKHAKFITFARVLMVVGILRITEIGDVFCTIGVRELQKTASEAFCQFGEYHRQMEKYGIKMLKATKPVNPLVFLPT